MVTMIFLNWSGLLISLPNGFKRSMVDVVGFSMVLSSIGDPFLGINLTITFLMFSGSSFSTLSMTVPTSAG